MNEIDELDKWKITDNFGEKSPCCLIVENEWYEAYIKWDGCVEITDKSDDGESHHICDIPLYIEMLKSLDKFRLENIESAE